MKKNKRLVGAIASFTAASACLIGGTYAWFVVANTAETNIIGTVAEIEDVKIGLKSDYLLYSNTCTQGVDCLVDTADELLNDYGLIKETAIDRPGVYWSVDSTTGEGIGKFNKTGLLEIVAGLNGYGNTLTPVTTGAYEDNQIISLKKGLDRVPDKAFENNYTAALKSDYLSYTLVFQTPEPGSKIHLKSTATEITSSGASAADVVSSLRVGFVDNKLTPAPGDDASSIFKFAQTSGETNVGGRMDLDGDNVWDYFEFSSGKYEIFYGDFTDLDYDDDEIDFGTSDDTLYGIKYNSTAVDVAGGGILPGSVIDGSNDVFLGTAATKSLVGAYTLDNIGSIVPKTQEYHALSDYIPGQNSIITTDATGYGELTIKVWIEGWDEKCINDISDQLYTVNLSFVVIQG